MVLFVGEMETKTGTDQASVSAEFPGGGKTELGGAASTGDGSTGQGQGRKRYTGSPAG